MVSPPGSAAPTWSAGPSPIPASPPASPATGAADRGTVWRTRRARHGSRSRHPSCPWQPLRSPPRSGRSPRAEQSGTRRHGRPDTHCRSARSRKGSEPRATARHLRAVHVIGVQRDRRPERRRVQGTVAPQRGGTLGGPAAVKRSRDTMGIACRMRIACRRGPQTPSIHLLPPRNARLMLWAAARRAPVSQMHPPLRPAALTPPRFIVRFLDFPALRRPCLPCRSCPACRSYPACQAYPASRAYPPCS